MQFTYISDAFIIYWAYRYLDVNTLSICKTSNYSNIWGGRWRVAIFVEHHADFSVHLCIAKVKRGAWSQAGPAGWKAWLHPQHHGIMSGTGEIWSGGCHTGRKSGNLFWVFFAENHFTSLLTYIWFWDTSVLHVFTHTITEWCFWLWMLRYALWQLERTEQFFAADGLPHLMFFYQEPEPIEAGNWKVYTH